MKPATSKRLSLTGLIAGHASRQPHAVAASCWDKRLTYGELQLKSSQLARALQRRGIRRGDKVVVLTQRCLEMIVCFYAILKTGACYVPLDADNLSQSRIYQTVQHVRPVIAVVTKIGFELDCPTLSWVEMDSATEVDLPHAGFHSYESEPEELQPEDLAYIIYTSGTTSTPKGVMIPHRALLNYVQQGDPQTPFNMGVTPLDKVLLLFSPAFDGSSPSLSL
jgi:gliotoxin/aspirochlorine biosynthesis peptide synthetase